MMKTLIAALLLVPAISLAQDAPGGSNASRIKKKAQPATQEAPEAAIPIEKFQPVTIESPPAPNQCKKPDLTVKITSKATGDAFNARNQNYRDCVQDYVNAQKVAADQHSAAANTMVQEFNAFSTELNSTFGKKE